LGGGFGETVEVIFDQMLEVRCLNQPQWRFPLPVFVHLPDNGNDISKARMVPKYGNIPDI
jgi:hypothetical protein